MRGTLLSLFCDGLFSLPLPGRSLLSSSNCASYTLAAAAAFSTAINFDARSDASQVYMSAPLYYLTAKQHSAQGGRNQWNFRKSRLDYKKMPRQEKLFSSVPPVNFLASVSDPCRGSWADISTFQRHSTSHVHCFWICKCGVLKTVFIDPCGLAPLHTSLFLAVNQKRIGKHQNTK